MEVWRGGGGGGYVDVNQSDVLFVNSDRGGLKLEAVGWVWGSDPIISEVAFVKGIPFRMKVIRPPPPPRCLSCLSVV